MDSCCGAEQRQRSIMERCRARNPLADFIHKLKLALKEQRGSKNNLRIIEGAGLMPANEEDHAWLLKECLELIAILAKSVNTAEKNKDRRK